MIARISTVAFQGVEVIPIDVQVQISNGTMPSFTIVGLPDKAVGESRERVRSALSSIGLGLPPKRITVNLSPADIQKEGSHYDLPIALALLIGMRVLPHDELANYTALGELGLDGKISRVAGILPAAVDAVRRGQGLICPKESGGEAAWAGDLTVLAPANLLAIVNHFKGAQLLAQPEPKMAEANTEIACLSDIKGQETARRALEVTAAGGHNLIMTGPPGAGKSMLACRMPGILPPLAPAEALEVTMIHSVAGKLIDGKLITTRPYRDPHHSSSLPALIGGGVRAKPGEVSLAHLGVLFLDELPEFNRATLEALRQPLESGYASISRANAHITYPARVQLIAAMNPCKCGYMTEPERACSRAPRCGSDYLSRISGPLLDRIDINIDVPAVMASDLAGGCNAEGSKSVALRVARARAIQNERFKQVNIRTNAEADGKLLLEIASPDPEGQKLLENAAEKFKLSARGYHRVLRVARTLADLEACANVRQSHIAEALSYRKLY